MKIEIASHSKYRAPGRLGDDVFLALPGGVFGVFDGATDARGTLINGLAAGRFAALTVSGASAALLADQAARELPADDIIAHLSAALARRTNTLDLPIPPSTTLALCIEIGANWRFIALGDSGFRLNGQEVLCTNKIIDDVSTHARVALFAHLQSRLSDPDAVEIASRQGIFLGFDKAVVDGVLPERLARQIIRDTIAATGLSAHADVVRTFLSGGICTQHRYANASDNALCFDTMNGTAPVLGQMIDETRPKEAIQSIEIFSDGYPDVPAQVSTAAWEAAFAKAEAVDFHKIGRFATVKGSTTTEYFDDRTVIVMSGL